MLIELKFDGQQLQTHSASIPCPPPTPQLPAFFPPLLQNLLAFCQSHSLENRANG